MTGRTVRAALRIVLGTSIVAGMLVQASVAHAAATITVTTTLDEYTTGPTTCSLREAITSAQSNGDFDGCVGTGTYGDDTILLDPGTYTLSLTGTEDTGVNDLDICCAADGLTIQSDGGTAQDTIIQAGTVGGPSGNAIDRVFHIDSPGGATLRDLTIRNGEEAGDIGGGAIRNEGFSLTLERVAVQNSVSHDDGGGIWSNALLELSQVEISGNQTEDVNGSGGGIFATGNVFADNTTISGNQAMNNGGGMALVSSGFHGIAGTTIAGNMSNSDNTGGGDGGGVFRDGTADANFAGSIIADNSMGPIGSSGPDCSGTFNTTGAFAFNVIENGAGCTGFEAADIGLDPQLQPLALNTPGTTKTHAILNTSPAKDRWPLDGAGGPEDGCQTNVGKFGVQTSDQRGVTRPQGGACDSGAFELEPTVPGVCKGKTATITGTQENDALVGTGANDIIAALGGNDTVNGAGKNDLVCGGDGNDKLKGGGGKDQLLGEKGNDNLKGGGGDKDKAIGGPGKDKCSGGGGEKDKAKKCETVKAVP